MSERKQSPMAEPRTGDVPRNHPDGEAPRRRTPPIRRWKTAIEAAALIFLVGLLGWQVHARRDYWEAAWTEGTLFPSEVGNLAFAQADGQAPGTGDFDLSKVTVPADEIHGGGPPKDGIPALTNPNFIPAKEAHYLRPQDRVIGFVAGDEARAYPLKILNYHEIVNDRVADVAVAVTYCPLCDSAAAFDRRTPLGEREFGVSGLLYNSNVLMFDRGGKPESLWSQLKSEGISGPASEKSLEGLPVELTTWQDWQARYPTTKVLSSLTGHYRDYDRNPYSAYFDQPQLMFPARPTSDRLPTKARVLGVWAGDKARAYPESAFSRQNNRIEEEIGGKKIIVEFNPDAGSLRVIEADDGVQWMYSLWFAWYAFRPETTIYQ